MRTIKVYSTTQNTLQTVSIDGNTFGELKTAVQAGNNVVGRGRTTRSTYETNDALISPSDEYIFIGPKKMDSGATLSDNFLEQLGELKEEFLEKVDQLFNDLFAEVDTEVDHQVENNGNINSGTEDCGECSQLKVEAQQMGFKS